MAAAASMPMTPASSRLLLPSLLAPWSPVEAASPTTLSPSISVDPSTPATTPPTQ